MLNSKFIRLALALSATLLAGCTSLDSLNRESKHDEIKSAALAESRQSEAGSKEKQNPSAADIPTARSQIFNGSGKVINMPKARKVIDIQGDAVTLNFEHAPLEDVVHGVLGEILKLDYIIEAPVKGNVTLRTQTAVPRQQLLTILESLLQSKKAIMAQDEHGRYIVSGANNISGIMPQYDNPESQGAGFSHVIVPLEHIGALELVEILAPVASDRAFVRVDALRNLLILAGTRVQMTGWLDIINTFDIDLLDGMSVGIFPIQYSEVTEVTQAIELLLAGADGKSISLSGLIRMVPLETLGSILVVTPKAGYLEKIKTWITRLDKVPEYGLAPELFVYRVQNGDASHLGELISDVFGGQSTGSNKRSNAGVAPGLTPTSLSGTKGSRTKKNSANSTQGSQSFNLNNDVRIIADEINNSLLIYSTHAEYRKIESALKKLDVTPLQVLIEASIIEVTLTDELKYGINWDMNNNLGNGWTGAGHLQIGEVFGPVGPGLSYSFINPLGDLKAVLNTLAAKDLVRVLSTPSIMVLDNQQALIHVGTQQPVRSTQTITDGGTINNSVTYRDTGVKLDVQPSVNASGLVTMDIKQSVTDINQPEGSGDVGFFERNIESRVAVRSGEAVVLGGLISTKNATGKDGIPFLHDLPLIGNLFGTTAITEVRTELLVIITPYVVKNDQDLRDVTQEMRNRLKSLSTFDEETQTILD